MYSNKLALMALLLCTSPALAWRFGGNSVAGSAPVVNASTFPASEPAATSQAIGQASATNSPTSWSITSCSGCSGYFAIDSTGHITVTSTGSAAITGNNTATITTFSPVLQATNASGSGSATVTINFYADGSIGTAVGTPQFPTLLNAYGGAGGRVPTNGFQPPWKVAGVDYQVGVPTGTVLSDPQAGGLPAGCSLSGQNIFCGPGTMTLNAWDFSLHGGYQVICQSSANLTITNSNFGIGTNGNAMIRTDYSGGCATAVFTHDTFDAHGLVDNLNNTNILSGAANFTIEYCLVQNASSDLIDLTSTSTNLMQWNLFYNAGEAAGSHPDWLQLGGSTYTVTLQYNTYYQPAVTTGPGTQGIFADNGNNGATVSGANTIAGNTIVAASGSQVNYAIGALANTGGGNTFLIDHNYIDPTGIGNSVYKYVSAQNTQTNNIKMTTGGTCNGACPP